MIVKGAMGTSHGKYGAIPLIRPYRNCEYYNEFTGFAVGMSVPSLSASHYQGNIVGFERFPWPDHSPTGLEPRFLAYRNELFA